MDFFFDKLFMPILATFMAPLMLFLLYLMFYLVPMSFYGDVQCKAKGYPKADVTILGDIYCMNLDGSVTVKVDRLK